MKNSHLPISERLEFGRICKRCFNGNDHIVIVTDEARNRQRMTCPECGLVTEKDHAQGTFEWIDGKHCLDGKPYHLIQTEKNIYLQFCREKIETGSQQILTCVNGCKIQATLL